MNREDRHRSFRYHPPTPLSVDMNDLTDFLKELQTTAWKTSGSRFNAARRLKRRDFVSTFSIAGFSAISFGIAFVQNVYSIAPDTPLGRYLTVVSGLLGLFVIVISLIEWGVISGTRAEFLMQNGMELVGFYRKIQQRVLTTSDINSSEVDLLREEYEQIKSKCPYNHDPIDYQYFCSEHRLSKEFLDKKENPKICWVHGQWIALKAFLSGWWYFGFFWIVILFLLFSAWQVSGLGTGLERDGNLPPHLSDNPRGAH